MVDEKLEKTFNDVKEGLQILGCIDDPEKIESTARELEAVSYSPLFLIELKGFLRYTKKDAVWAIEHIYEYRSKALKKTPLGKDYGAAEIKIKALLFFLKEFELLQQLREGKPEAWDEINELYEDD